MASIKDMAAEIDLDPSGDISMLRDIFGFRRGRVPNDVTATDPAEVSLLDQVKSLKTGIFFNFNAIRVGDEDFGDDELDEIDFAIYRTRQIFDDEGIGVGRVRHAPITKSDAGGYVVIDSRREATNLTKAFMVDNDGIDVFFVLSIDADFVGLANINGPCDKTRNVRTGCIVELDRIDDDRIARTTAHELGHYLGLTHKNGDPTNLMAQTKHASNIRTSVLLTGRQVGKADGHCSIHDRLVIA